jgi:hypothetical protein
MTENLDDASWSSAWPDLLAFVGGLAAAWWGQWRTADLVWSLWLSSLVVGYTMLLWGIVRPAVDFFRAMDRDPTASRAIAENGTSKNVALAGLALLYALFIVAFFTVHFGGFHYVHSMLLGHFFPVEVGGAAAEPGMPMYAEIARRYWIFLPSAFLAERAVFKRRSPAPEFNPSVTAEAIAARKRANVARPPNAMTEPYRKVMRMHGLIFFFACAHFARLDNFALYAVVYAVYFFPWRLTRSPARLAAPV